MLESPIPMEECVQPRFYRAVSMATTRSQSSSQKERGLDNIRSPDIETTMVEVTKTKEVVAVDSEERDDSTGNIQSKKSSEDISPRHEGRGPVQTSTPPSNEQSKVIVPNNPWVILRAHARA